MNVGPCEAWPVQWGNCDLTGVSPTVQSNAVMAATEILWALSGRQFGECPVTVRPCPDNCLDSIAHTIWPLVDAWPYPTLMDGSWYNLGCGGSCFGDCSCNTVFQFTLPGTVASIIEIRIDGSVVPTGSYRLDNGRYVVRTDGKMWPFCNNLSASSGPGTWTVTYMVGAEVPMLGQMAVGELACEFIKAGTSECRLPARVQNLSRQGVSMTLLDPQEFLTEGRVGLYVCDLFITSWNPAHLPSKPRVASPDTPRFRQRVV